MLCIRLPPMLLLLWCAGGLGGQLSPLSWIGPFSSSLTMIYILMRQRQSPLWGGLPASFGERMLSLFGRLPCFHVFLSLCCGHPQAKA